MSVINTNITSLIGQANLTKSQGALQTSMQRLSSGLRINSAKDDAAGQAIANRMSSQIKGLAQAQRNANDGISVAQTTEGALNQINDNLQRIRELSVQAQNGTNNSDDLTSIQNEIGQRLNEINRISEETNFNGVKVLSEDNQLKIQVGSQDGQTISIDLKKINAKTLGLDGFNVDGKGVTQNRTATVTDLIAAGGATNAAGNYDVTISFDAVKLDRMLSEMQNGDTVVTDAGNAGEATYTYDAANGNFTYTKLETGYAALANGHAPTTGTKSGSYEFADGSVANFEVDATGKLTIGGQAAYLNAGGELTTNDPSGAATQATLEDVLTAMGDDSSANDTTKMKLTIDGRTYTGSDSTDPGVSYTATATTSEVLAAANGVTADVTLTRGITSTTVAFDNAGGTTDVYVDRDGELTTTGSYDTEYSVNAETGAVKVVSTTGTGKYESEVGAAVYVSSAGRLTTDTTSKGERTENPLATLDSALKMVDSLRSDLGAIQNRFESAITNLQTNETNLSAARSRIEDADYAKEVANMTRAQILQQAGTSVLAQANQVPQGVLSLLR